MNTINQETKIKKQENKIKNLQALCGSMMHQIGMPLAASRALLKEIDEQVPTVINEYLVAVKRGKIEGNSKLINHENLPKQIYAVIHRIENALYLMEHHQMNIYADSKEMTIDMEAFTRHSISKVIETAIEEFPFPEKAAYIKWNPSNDFVVNGEHKLLECVVHNLLENAVTALESYTGSKNRILIWLDSDKNGSYVHVQDNGLGVQGQRRKVIFEAFYTTSADGAGLGLYFCKAVMRAHLGEISVYSRSGQYTHFILTFPKPEALEKYRATHYNKVIKANMSVIKTKHHKGL